MAVVLVMVVQPEVPLADDSQRITLPVCPVKVMVAEPLLHIVGVVVEVVPAEGGFITVTVIGFDTIGEQGALVTLIR